MTTSWRSFPQAALGSIAVAAVALTQGSVASNAQGPSGLILHLDTGKRVHALYEPVNVTYTLANLTDRVVESTVIMRFPASGLKLTIRPEAGTATRYLQGGFLDMVSTKSTQHRPGEVMADTVSISFNYETGRLAFPTPGIYHIGATMGVDPGPSSSSIAVLTANEVEIEVVPPGPDEEAAIAYLGGPDEMIRLLRDGAVSYCKGREAEGCSKRLIAFVTEHPRSAYAPYLAYYLAGMVKVGVVRHSDDSTAVSNSLLQEFLDRWPDHPLWAQVAKQAMYQLGSSPRARELLDTYRHRFPERASEIEYYRRRVAPEENADGAN